jgi:hypothetical protein
MTRTGYILSLESTQLLVSLYPLLQQLNLNLDRFYGFVYMTSTIDDDQWDFIKPPSSTTTTTTMAATTEQPSSTPTPSTEPKIEVTINTKSAEKKNTPKLAREHSIDSTLSASDVDVEEIPRPRPARRTRRYSVSPVRYNRFPSVPQTPMLNSSAQLLEQVGFDGIADMPFPGRNSIYLTTFPFTNRDVKKWSWLFIHGVEEMWLTAGSESGRDNDDDDDIFDDDFYDGARCVPRVTRNRRVFNGPMVDVPSVYLSRALDTSVIPEDTTERVKYLIVVQNRSKPSGGAKLLTAESRKAAGITMFYEALTGNSVVFVGAVVGSVGKTTKKFRKATDVAEAKGMNEGGVIGIVC